LAVDLLRLVVLFGSFETLQWCTASVLKQAGALPSLINRQALSFCAASRGDVRILAWLQQARLLEFEWQNAHGARWALTDTAAKQGHLETVQLLPPAWCVRPVRQQPDTVSLPFCSGAMSVALRSGRLSLPEQLVKQAATNSTCSSPSSAQSCGVALQRKHLRSQASTVTCSL